MSIRQPYNLYYNNIRDTIITALPSEKTNPRKILNRLIAMTTSMLAAATINVVIPMHRDSTQ